jgi:hypothetical protein
MQKKRTIFGDASNTYPNNTKSTNDPHKPDSVKSTMSIEHEKSLQTLNIFFDDWLDDNLNTVLCHYAGDLNQSIFAIQALRGSPASDLLDTFESSYAQASIAIDYIYTQRQIAKQEDAAEASNAAAASNAVVMDLITPDKLNNSNADPVSSSNVIDLTISIKNKSTSVAKRSASARDTKSPATDAADARFENKKKRKPGDNLFVEEFHRNANRKRKPSSSQVFTSFFKKQPKSARAVRAAAVVTPPSPVINANPKKASFFKPIKERNVDAPFLFELQSTGTTGGDTTGAAMGSPIGAIVTGCATGGATGTTGGDTTGANMGSPIGAIDTGGAIVIGGATGGVGTTGAATGTTGDVTTGAIVTCGAATGAGTGSATSTTVGANGGVTGASPGGAGVSDVIYCKARGMPLDHIGNNATLHFQEGYKGMHGARLQCSHLSCKNIGFKFRICKHCEKAVGRWNFRQKHAHPELISQESTAVLDITTTTITDVQELLKTSENKKIRNTVLNGRSLDKFTGPESKFAIQVFDLFVEGGNKPLGDGYKADESLRKNVIRQFLRIEGGKASTEMVEFVAVVGLKVKRSAWYHFEQNGMLPETFAALKGRIRDNIRCDLRKGFITKDQEKDLLDKVLRMLPEFFEHRGIWNLKAGETWISPFGYRITGNVFEQLFGDAQDAIHNLLTLSLDRIEDSKPHFDPMAEDVAGLFANVKPEPRMHNTPYKAQHEDDIDTVNDLTKKILALTAIHPGGFSPSKKDKSAFNKAIHVMINHFRRRDKQKKIVYPGDDALVTVEKVQSLLETQNYQCALTGAPLLPPGRGEKWRKFSVDAIVPSLGHCLSNIRIICTCFNAQFNLSDEDKEKIGQDRVKHENGNFINNVRLLRELGILEDEMGSIEDE